MRKIPQQAIDIVCQFEGCELTAYPDPATKQDPWTIGYGHTGSEVVPGLTITKEKAIELLTQDLEHCASVIQRTLPKTKLSDNQFSAICSLIFNIGSGNFRASSVFKALAMSKYKEAAEAILLWDKARDSKGVKIVLPGLTRRRKAEKALFEKA